MSTCKIFQFFGLMSTVMLFSLKLIECSNQINHYLLGLIQANQIKFLFTCVTTSSSMIVSNTSLLLFNFAKNGADLQSCKISSITMNLLIKDLLLQSGLKFQTHSSVKTCLFSRNVYFFVYADKL